MNGSWTYRIDIDPDELQAIGITQNDLEQLFANASHQNVDGYHIYLEMPDMDASSGTQAAEYLVLEELATLTDSYSASELDFLISGSRTF